MAIIKCKMCGGDLEVTPGTSVAECEYCGTQQTLPKLNDDKRANMYDRANHFRRHQTTTAATTQCSFSAKVQLSTNSPSVSQTTTHGLAFSPKKKYVPTAVVWWLGRVVCIKF